MVSPPIMNVNRHQKMSTIIKRINLSDGEQECYELHDITPLINNRMDYT